MSDREQLVQLLIDNRFMGYAASVYTMDPPVMADAILASNWLKAHDAKVAADTAERIAGVVKDQREKYLASPELNRAWVAGWHAATDHIANTIARADTGADQ